MFQKYHTPLGFFGWLGVFFVVVVFFFVLFCFLKKTKQNYSAELYKQQMHTPGFQHKSSIAIQPVPQETMPTKEVLLPLQSEGELPLLRKGFEHNWEAEVRVKQSTRGQQKSNIS